MGRTPSKGPYVPLAAHYYLDDAILEAGADAELLFVRTLSFLAAIPTDGYVTDRQLATVVGLGLRALPKRIERLVEVGLFEKVSGGFVVRSWTKWNRTAEEIGRARANDRERKARKVGEDAPNSARNPAEIEPESGSSTEQSSTEQIDTLDLPVEPPSSSFIEFWAAYPRKAGKDAARRAFEKAARRVPASAILDGARRLAADPNLPELQFIPHPATWLNRGGWDDDPMPPRSGPTPSRERLEDWQLR